MVGSGLDLADPLADRRRTLTVAVAVAIDGNSFVMGRAGVALGTVAGQPLANGHPWLTVDPLAQGLAFADEPDGLAVCRAFLAVGLAAGAVSIR